MSHATKDDVMLKPKCLPCAHSGHSQESADRSVHHLACGQVDLSFCDFIQCIEGHVRMLPALSLSGAHL